MVLEGLASIVTYLNNTPEWLAPLESFFLQPLALLLLPVVWGLIFLIYTVRNKPRKLTVPSVMFITNQKTKNSPRRFFFKIPINILLLLHLLIALALILAMAQPFINIPRSQAANDVVLIIDASMSMQADNRFDDAIDMAQSHISETNTIILINEIPTTVAENVNGIAALSLLERLEPSDTLTALPQGVQHAADLGKTGANIHVYTDGIGTVAHQKGLESIIAQLESQNNQVFIHEFRQGDNNVAFVTAEITKNVTDVQIKNYGGQDKTVNILLGGQSAGITVPAYGVATADFTTPPGDSLLELQTDDDIKSDNYLYITNPYGKKYSVLYLSNNPNKFLQLALSLMDFVEVTYDEPPGEQVGNYDMYILDAVDPSKLLPATLPAIQERVESGAGLIIAPTRQMTALDYKDLLPVSLSDETTKDVITVFPSQYVEDVAIGGQQTFLLAGENDNTTILAASPSAVALARKKLGEGTVYYYGLQQGSSFELDFTYPLLFKRWIEDSVNLKAIEEVNVQVGTVLGAPNVIVQSPDETKVTGRVAARQIGYYQVGPIRYAVNVLSDKESDIQGSSVQTKQERIRDLSAEDTEVPKSLWFYFLVSALVLLFLEFWLLKWRGEA